MEKKNSKKNIDKVIYVLIGAMLVCMLLVTVLTATLRRGTKPPEAESTRTAETTVREYAAVKPREERTEKATETTEAETEKPRPAINEVTEEVPVSAGIRYYVLPVKGSVAKAFEIDIPV